MWTVGFSRPLSVISPVNLAELGAILAAPVELVTDGATGGKLNPQPASIPVAEIVFENPVPADAGKVKEA
jgi:hypothetical protein